MSCCPGFRKPTPPLSSCAATASTARWANQDCACRPFRCSVGRGGLGRGGGGGGGRNITTCGAAHARFQSHISLHCSTGRISMHCMMMHCTALRFAGLLCTALHCPLYTAHPEKDRETRGEKALCRYETLCKNSKAYSGCFRGV